MAIMKGVGGASTTGGDPGAKPMSRRTRLALRRWVEVLGAGVVGAAVILPLLSWRRSDLHSAVAVPPWILIAAVVAVCVFTLTFRLGESRWGPFTGTRHLASYPPLWIGSLWGIGIVLLAIGYFEQIRKDLWLGGESAPLLVLGGALCIAAVALLAFASGVALVFRGPPSPMVSRQQILRPLPRSDSFERLREWLVDDSAPQDATADMFGHSQIAQRIAERFLDPRPPAQAVVGRLGAGKTTLRSLVTSELGRMAAGRRVQVVPIELWPYETSRAAVEGVIRALVKVLAKEVNVIGLRGLAGAYAEAMSAAGGWFAALVRAQGIPASPLESLNAIDDVATVIGIRYVVWIEDLERFASEGASEASEEKLNPIRALLYGLDRLDSMTVVTATTTLRVRFDIEKIARYVESLPDLAAPFVAKTLGLFRNGCREMLDVIDPAARAVREELDALSSDSGYWIREALAERGVYSAAAAVSILCVTPRAMKQALRACFDVWSRLPGEIDFDDLLILCIIRETQPAAFALIQDSLPNLREGRAAKDEDRGKAQKAWEKSLGDLPMDDRSRAAVKYLVEFMFGARRVPQKPQGVFHRYPVDYWERFLAVPRLEDDERDQEILRTILAEDDVVLLDLLQQTASRKSAAVERFEGLLSTERVVRLLALLVDRRSRESPSSWSDQKPPGLISLGRMWRRRWERDALPSATVLDKIKRALDVAIPHNLALAIELENHFVVSPSGVRELLELEEKWEAKKYLRHLLVVNYQDRSDALSERLRGTKTPTLLWLCWGLDGVQSEATGRDPFAGWEAFARTVVEAARLLPKVMLPQIAWLLVRNRVMSVEPHQQYEFDPAAAARLLGGIEKVVELFGHEEAADWAGVPGVEAVEAVLAYLRKEAGRTDTESS